LTAETYIERHLPEAEVVTEADARSFFDEHQDQWVQSARREVHNIFLRADEQNPVGALAKTADEIRRRLERGESFAALAEQYSDSESRHQGGFVGWLEPRHLTPALAEVVFSLEEGQLSESFETPQGVHLFLVTGIIQHGDVPFSEALPRIMERLAAARREALVLELAEALPEVSGTFVAGGEDLESLMRYGEAEAVVLRVGSYLLDVGRLRQMAAKVIADGQAPSEGLAERLLELLARRERIFAEASRQGLTEETEVEKRVQTAVSRVEVSMRRGQIFEQSLDADPKPMIRWFETNQRRFSTPLRLEVTRLVVPLEASTLEATVPVLEGLSRAEASSAAFEEVAGRLGGRIERDGWKTLNELAAIRPMAARLASTLNVGQVSAPYRTVTTLEVLRVDDRQEPETQTLAAVFDRVRSEYLKLHAAEIYGRWAQSTLEAVELRIFPERVVGSAGQLKEEEPHP